MSAVTPERFAKGMTFDEYVRYVGSAGNLAREAWGGYFPDSGSFGAERKDNSAVFRERYAILPSWGRWTGRSTSLSG